MLKVPGNVVQLPRVPRQYMFMAAAVDRELRQDSKPVDVKATFASLDKYRKEIAGE